jgi:hypothetical protein
VCCLHMSGDRLHREELSGAVYAAEALLAVWAGAPVLRPHVGLQAHLQRELLSAETAVVLQHRDAHQLINQSVISNQLIKQKLCLPPCGTPGTPPAGTAYRRIRSSTAAQQRLPSINQPISNQ